MGRYGLRVRENQEKAVAFVSPFPQLLSPRVRRDPTQKVYRLRMSPDDYPTGATCAGYLGHPFGNQKVPGYPANCSATSVALTNLMQASVFHHRALFDVLLLATPGKTPNRRCCTFSGSRLVYELGQPLRPSSRRRSPLLAALRA